MIIVGITGNIGSGKSTVCNIIKENFNYEVFSFDEIAKRLANNNVDIMNEIIEEFGYDSYDSNLKYNSKYISDIVFNDYSKLNKLNSIFKPYLLKEYFKIVNDQSFAFNNKNKIIFFESALIIELELQKHFDIILTVCSNKNTIIKRLKERNKLTVEDIEKRLNSQLEIEYLLRNSHYSIVNIDETTKSELYRQIYYRIKTIKEDYALEHPIKTFI